MCVRTEAAVQLGTASEADYAHPLAEQLVEVALAGAVAPLKRHVGLTHAGHLLSLLLVLVNKHPTQTPAGWSLVLRADQEVESGGQCNKLGNPN
jgi:hypothetical protein